MKRRIPLRAVLGDRVKHGQQLAHTCHEGDLLAPASGEQMHALSLEDCVVAHGGQGGHVQGATHVFDSSPERALAAHLAGVAVQRCHADQGGHSAAIELAQLGQLSQQHRHAGRTDARHGAQGGGQLGVMPLDMGCDFSVAVGEFFLEELDDALDAGSSGDLRMRWRSEVIGGAAYGPAAAAARRRPAA